MHGILAGVVTLAVLIALGYAAWLTFRSMSHWGE